LNPQPFYGVNTRLIRSAPRIYFNYLGEAAAVRCLLCNRTPHVFGWGKHLFGWGKHLRRVCGLRGTFYLIGTRYACKDCPGEPRLA
jgi:hypothetical protein